jgi:TolB-like protein
MREVSDDQATAPAQKATPTPVDASFAPNTTFTVPQSWQWLVTAVTIGAFVLAQAWVWLGAPKAAATQTEPSILVEPFEPISKDPAASRMSQGLSYEVVNKLVSLKTMIVKADSASSARDSVYVLQGTVLMDRERLRSSARLVRRSDGAVVWAENYDGDLGEETVFKIQSRIAESIVASVVQPRPVIDK